MLVDLRRLLPRIVSTRVRIQLIERSWDDAALEGLTRDVVATLTESGEVLACAESCTGGWIAKLLTDMPGSTAWLDSAMVVYSYAAKAMLLGVQARTLRRHGAVSEETVREMVGGALARSTASVAVAVTGVAGPGGGVPGKPVGTVWVGWQRRADAQASAELFHFSGDRDAVRRQTVAAALQGVRQMLTR